jgi:hypothetical protein
MIIQLLGANGEPVGLFETTRTDEENFQNDFDAALSNLDTEDVLDNAEDWLSTHKNIHRIYVDIVVTTETL